MSIQNFRFWCQKVLPLVYDDSLSYYELLCKVVDKLNEVIETQNKVGNDVTELTKMFNQLKNYVYTYFNNLDVQGEINNKLDDMVKDGTLATVINTQIFNELNEKIDAIKQYKGSDKAWNITEIKKQITMQQQFTRRVTGEAIINKSDVTIAYTGETQYFPLDMPITESFSDCTLDSYYGYSASNRVTNNAVMRCIPMFADKSINGTTANVLFKCLVSGLKATPKDNPTYSVLAKRQNAVDIAKSYYDARVGGREYSYGANFVTYSNNNVVNDSLGRARMECDTLVALVMMGIPYELSPFAVTTANYQYNFDDLAINPNGLSWCLPWKYDDIYKRKITYTGAQNWYYWYNGLVYKNSNNLSSGDIAIFTNPESYNYFDHISHTGIIEMVDGIPYIYHITGANGVESPMMYEPLQNVIDRGGYEGSNKGLYFARPNYA